MKKFFLKHWYKLVSLQATPKAIASGFAVGVWWGFTPFIGLKTVMAIFTSWVTRTNKIAAAIGVTMHDMLLPFFFFVLYFQYQVGCLILRKSPERIHNIELWAAEVGPSPFTWAALKRIFQHLYHWFRNGCHLSEASRGLSHDWGRIKIWAGKGFHSWVTWEAFYRFCLPIILGAVLVGTLLAIGSYFAMKYFVTKFQEEQSLMNQLRKTGILPKLAPESEATPTD